jgi:hypothetical protein
MERGIQESEGAGVCLVRGDREEQWRQIEEFPNYDVSTRGRIYNRRAEQFMQTSRTNFGHMKVTLTLDGEGRSVKFRDGDGEEQERIEKRFTRSGPRLVADAFLGKGNVLWDQVIMKDGDFENVQLDNLAWRPRTFSWKYTRQLRVQQPRHFESLPVINTETDIRYSSIIEAGMAEGLLFADIWRSTYSGERVFPTGSIFIVDQRV